MNYSERIVNTNYFFVAFFKVDLLSPEAGGGPSLDCFGTSFITGLEFLAELDELEVVEAVVVLSVESVEGEGLVGFTSCVLDFVTLDSDVVVTFVFAGG